MYYTIISIDVWKCSRDQLAITKRMGIRTGCAPSMASIVREAPAEVQVQENKNRLGPWGDGKGEGKRPYESIILGALGWVQADRHQRRDVVEITFNPSMNLVHCVWKKPFTALIYTGECIPSAADPLQSSQMPLRGPPS